MRGGRVGNQLTGFYMRGTLAYKGLRSDTYIGNKYS